MGQLSRLYDRIVHACRILQWHATALQNLPDTWRITADQDHAPRKARNGFSQRTEVLALAITTQDHHHATVKAQTVQSSHGCPHIRALAVVEIFHFMDDGHRFHAVWLTPVFAQAVKHGAQGATGMAGQRQGRQRIDGVVTTPNTQGICGYQALDVQLLGFFFATPAGFIGFQGTYQPGHAVHHFNTEIARPGWHVATKCHAGALQWFLQLDPNGLGTHGHNLRVFTVQHHQGLCTKNSGLGCCISGHRAVPIQMVL